MNKMVKKNLCYASVVLFVIAGVITQFLDTDPITIGYGYFAIGILGMCSMCLCCCSFCLPKNASDYSEYRYQKIRQDNSFKKINEVSIPQPNTIQRQKINQIKEKLKLQNFEREQELLIKFKKLMQSSSKIQQDDCAKLLGLGNQEFSKKLLEWSELLPFKIDGNMIIVENISDFAFALD
jgi:hypothetical protein